MPGSENQFAVFVVYCSLNQLLQCITVASKAKIFIVGSEAIGANFS